MIVKSDGSADQLLRQVALPYLLSENAKKMKAMKVAFISRENVSVAVLGLSQLTSLVVAHGPAQ